MLHYYIQLDHPHLSDQQVIEQSLKISDCYVIFMHQFPLDEVKSYIIWGEKNKWGSLEIEITLLH